MHFLSHYDASLLCLIATITQCSFHVPSFPILVYPISFNVVQFGTRFLVVLMHCSIHGSPCCKPKVFLHTIKTLVGLPHCKHKKLHLSHSLNYAQFKNLCEHFVISCFFSFETFGRHLVYLLFKNYPHPFPWCFA
jgi:hypothetical protein